MIVVVVIVIALVVALVRRSPSARPERHERQRSARDILDERYARGEIDADEYKKRRDDLAR